MKLLLITKCKIELVNFNFTLWPLFYGWGSTASRLQPLRGGSLLFTIQFPEILGTHFIDLFWIIFLLIYQKWWIRILMLPFRKIISLSSFKKVFQRTWEFECDSNDVSTSIHDIFHSCLQSNWSISIGEYFIQQQKTTFFRWLNFPRFLLIAVNRLPLPATSGIQPKLIKYQTLGFCTGTLSYQFLWDFFKHLCNIHPF